jgi:hypothetical protein
MAKITGVVQAIETRQVAGGKTAYNIRVGGESYGAGLYKPKCNEGDYVEFELDDSRGYKNVGRNSLRVSANKGPRESAPAPSPVARAANSFDSRQDTISRQAATNTAISWVTFLASQGALNVPASAKSVGQKMAAMDAIRAQYEKEFYENNTGQEFKSIAPNKPAGDEEDESPQPEDAPWEE